MATLIKNVEELIELCNDEQSHDCFVALKGGIRSSKSVFMNEDGSFSIINEIDWSEDEYTMDELSKPENSFIADAISKGAFYSYS